MADDRPYQQGHSLANEVLTADGTWLMTCHNTGVANRVVMIANEAYEAGRYAERTERERESPEEPPASPGYVDAPVHERGGFLWFDPPSGCRHCLTEAPGQADFMGFVYHKENGSKVLSESPILWRDRYGTFWDQYGQEMPEDATQVRPNAVRLRV